jgi:uncharacterized membrane protein YfcA
MGLNITLGIILLLFGLIFGLIATITGTGGGVFYVPFMTIFLFLPINISIDTSNFIILFTSLCGFVIFIRNRRSNLRISLIYSLFSILGSIASTTLLLMITFENKLLRFFFSTLLIVIGVYMFLKSFYGRFKANKNDYLNSIDTCFFDNFNYKSNLKTAVPLLFIAGFASNLFGIGGGVINTPALNIILKFPIHCATGVSISIVFFTAIINSISKFLFGTVDFTFGFLIGIGSIFGAIIGAKVSSKMSIFFLKLSVAIILIGFSIRMFFP